MAYRTIETGNGRNQLIDFIEEKALTAKEFIFMFLKPRTIVVLFKFVQKLKNSLRINKILSLTQYVDVADLLR